MPKKNAEISFAPPNSAEESEVIRAFGRISDVVSSIRDRLIDLDQPAIAYIADTLLPQFQLSAESVVEYSAPGGTTIVLPLANSVSGKRSRIIIIINSGVGTVTVAANAQDTVNGAASITIATGSHAIIRSNGNTKWFSK